MDKNNNEYMNMLSEDVKEELEYTLGQMDSINFDFVIDKIEGVDSSEDFVNGLRKELKNVALSKFYAKERLESLSMELDMLQNYVTLLQNDQKYVNGEEIENVIEATIKYMRAIIRGEEFSTKVQ
jgi:hypothetical protein